MYNNGSFLKAIPYKITDNKLNKWIVNTISMHIDNNNKEDTEPFSLSP